jgi:hypothetical protein
MLLLSRNVVSRVLSSPHTTLHSPDVDGLLHVNEMRYPTSDGWRNATSDELAEYEAALMRVQAEY